MERLQVRHACVGKLIIFDREVVANDLFDHAILTSPATAALVHIRNVARQQIVHLAPL
jgi:hypothetical protein